MYKGRPRSNLVRYEGTTLELRFFAWTLLFFNPVTIYIYTFLPSSIDLKNSFKVEVGWLSLKPHLCNATNTNSVLKAAAFQLPLPFRE